MSGYSFENTYDGDFDESKLRDAVYNEILMHLMSQPSNDYLSEQDRIEYGYNDPKRNARDAADRVQIVRPDYICANIDEAKRYPNSYYAIKYYDIEETSKTRNIRKRLEKEKMELENYKKAHNARNRKSAFVGCPHCKSKINREYIGDNNKCGVCGYDFYSSTDKDKITVYKKTIDYLTKEYEANVKKVVRWFVTTKYY